MNKLINIYEYFDYRKFLAEYYKVKKASTPSFSYRSFARKAGFNSSGYYSDVVSGKRNLSQQLLPKFILALGLTETEARFFNQLVLFDHATSTEAKQIIFEEVISLLPLRLKKIQSIQKDYFLKWYHVPIRELLAVLDVSDDYPKLASTLIPPITEGEAQKAIETLFQLKLIKKNEDGFWKAADNALISNKDDIGPFLLQQFHLHMLELAKTSLTNTHPDLNLFKTTTMSISEEGIDRIQHQIKKFQKSLIEIIESDVGEDRVYQFNLQMFPLSKTKDSIEE